MRGPLAESTVAQWMSVAAVLAAASVAGANTIVNESFMLSPNDYAVGDVTPQNPDSIGLTGAWLDGSTATSTWKIASGSLDAAADSGEMGGSIYFDTNSADRRVYRNIATYSAANTYFFSSLLQLSTGADLSGANVVGITSVNQASLSDTSFFNTTSANAVQGLIWGFEGNGSQIDMVLRTRKDTDPGAPQVLGMTSDTLVSGVSVGQTYQVVFKLERDFGSTPTGNDQVSVWINPSNLTSEVAAGAPNMVLSNFSLTNAGDLKQLVFASTGFANQVRYDEVRFGTGWADVATISSQVAYDNFQYVATAPTNVNTGTINGGDGWSGAWVNDGGTGTFAVRDPGTPLSANGVTGGDRAMAATGFSGTGPRSASRSLDAAESGDLFVRFLVRFDGTLETNDLFDFELLSGGNQVARFGMKEGAAGGDWFGSVNGGSTGFFGSFDGATDHMIVLRLSKIFGASVYNALSIWIDPSYLDLDNPLLTVTSGSSSFGSVDGLNFGQESLETADRVYFDELLLGSAWKDVVAVPAPGTLCMLTLGAAGLLRRRRA